MDHTINKCIGVNVLKNCNGNYVKMFLCVRKTYAAHHQNFNHYTNKK